MSPLFESIAAEHKKIRAVTAALAAFVAEVRAGAAVDAHEVLRFVTFLEAYSGGYHHEREERVLLPALVHCGFALDVGPLAHIRQEHREEHLLLVKLQMAAAARAPWTSAQREAFAVAAERVVGFTDAHIEKEIEYLLPVAQKEMLAGHATEVAELEQRFEMQRAPRWDAAWLESLGAELVAAHAGRV